MIETEIWFCSECGHRTKEIKGMWKYIDCPYCLEAMEVENGNNN